MLLIKHFILCVSFCKSLVNYAQVFLCFCFVSKVWYIIIGPIRLPIRLFVRHSVKVLGHIAKYWFGEKNPVAVLY